MAKLRKTANHPWLQAAVFCDQLLEDTTSALSVIRIIDKFFLPRPPDWDGKTPLGIPVTGLLSFKAGDVKGKRPLTLYMVSPKGKRKKVHRQEIEFFGADVGTNVKLRIGFSFKTDGTHWLEVYVGSWLATRMPLTLVLQPTDSQPGKPAGDGKHSEK